MKATCQAILLAFTVFLVFAGCSKSSDDESSSAEASYPATLSLGCGDTGTDNCFTDSSVTSLNLTAGESQLESMLMFSWIATGFPSKAKYDSTMSGIGTSASAKEKIPQEGMINRVEYIRKELVEKARAALGANAECSSAPTSGTLSLGNNETATWTTAKMKAPLDYPNSKGGKTYDKAVTLSKTVTNYTINYRFEFFCSYQGMAFVTEFKNAAGTSLSKFAFFYDGASKTARYSDFYLWDKEISSADLMLAFQYRQESAKKYKAWVTRTGYNSSAATTSLGYRYAINADLSLPKISMFTVEVGTSGTELSNASFLAHADVISTAVTATKAPSSNDNSAVTGCASSWMQAKTAITSNATCSGQDLSKAPAAFWATSAASELSMKDVHENLKSNVISL